MMRSVSTGHEWRAPCCNMHLSQAQRQTSQRTSAPLPSMSSVSKIDPIWSIIAWKHHHHHTQDPTSQSKRGKRVEGGYLRDAVLARQLADVGRRHTDLLQRPSGRVRHVDCVRASVDVDDLAEPLRSNACQRWQLSSDPSG
eukprot:3227357-Rhodomonas_salina.5